MTPRLTEKQCNSPESSPTTIRVRSLSLVACFCEEEVAALVVDEEVEGLFAPTSATRQEFEVIDETFKISCRIRTRGTDIISILVLATLRIFLKYLGLFV
jgi:hypothetical protein